MSKKGNIKAFEKKFRDIFNLNSNFASGTGDMHPLIDKWTTLQIGCIGLWDEGLVS